jgi:hypothetical protein
MQNAFSLHSVQPGNVAHPAFYPMRTGVFSSGVKRRGRESDTSFPSNDEVKNAWTMCTLPPYVFMAWCLIKYKSNFTSVLSFTAIREELSIGLL